MPDRRTWWNRRRYTLDAPVHDLAVAHLPVFVRARRRSFVLAALRPGERVLLVAAGTGLDLPFRRVGAPWPPAAAAGPPPAGNRGSPH